MIAAAPAALQMSALLWREQASCCCLSTAQIRWSGAHSWFIYGSSSRLWAAPHQLPPVSCKILSMAMPHALSTALHFCFAKLALPAGSAAAVNQSLLMHLSAAMLTSDASCAFLCLDSGCVLHRLQHQPGPFPKGDKYSRHGKSHWCVLQVSCCSSGHSRVLTSSPGIPCLPMPARCTALPAAPQLPGAPRRTVETHPQASCMHQVRRAVCTAVSHVLPCWAVMHHPGHPYQASDTGVVSQPQSEATIKNSRIHATSQYAWCRLWGVIQSVCWCRPPIRRACPSLQTSSSPSFDDNFQKYVPAKTLRPQSQCATLDLDHCNIACPHDTCSQEVAQAGIRLAAEAACRPQQSASYLDSADKLSHQSTSSCFSTDVADSRLELNDSIVT